MALPFLLLLFIRNRQPLTDMPDADSVNFVRSLLKSILCCRFGSVQFIDITQNWKERPKSQNDLNRLPG